MMRLTVKRARLMRDSVPLGMMDVMRLSPRMV